MFLDFTSKLKNVTKDKAGTEDVKTLQKLSLRWQWPSRNLLSIMETDTWVE